MLDKDALIDALTVVLWERNEQLYAQGHAREASPTAHFEPEAEWLVDALWPMIEGELHA
jgi:hypothetical protein